MSTGGKIAVGCGIVVLLGIFGVVAVVVGGAYWAKNKVAAVTAEQNHIEELKKKANANSFTRPVDGVIAEDRLVKFLEIRKRVYTIYVTHREELETMKNKKQAEFSDLTRGYTLINEVRLAQSQAQADIGMSEDEYRFMVEQVYKSMWAAEVAKQTGGKSVSQAAGEMYEKAASEMDRAAREAEAARRRARTAKDDAESGTAKDVARNEEQAADQASDALGKSAEEMRKAGDQVRDNAHDMDVPPANIALFQKYEADIKQYAMGGLELLGL